MRGWIIIDSLLASFGIVSQALDSKYSRVGTDLAALGIMLLSVTIAAKLIRGRA